MNLGDEYQKFLIFIALIIAGDEGWAMNFQQFSPNLSPATKLGDGAHRRGGNQTLRTPILKSISEPLLLKISISGNSRILSF